MSLVYYNSQAAGWERVLDAYVLDGTPLPKSMCEVLYGPVMHDLSDLQRLHDALKASLTHHRKNAKPKPRRKRAKHAT